MALTSAAEAASETTRYRSGEPLRHPKSNATPTLTGLSDFVRGGGRMRPPLREHSCYDFFLRA